MHSRAALVPPENVARMSRIRLPARSVRWDEISEEQAEQTLSSRFRIHQLSSSGTDIPFAT